MLLKALSVLTISTVGSFTSLVAQEFTLETGRESIEKRETLEIYLGIRTGDSAITEISVDEVLPDGFALEESDSVPRRVESGSSVQVWYKISAPRQGLGKKSPSTREAKRFVWNISYRIGTEGVVRTQAVTKTLRYTTSMLDYLLAGLGGLVLAHLIKSLAKAKTADQKQLTLGKIVKYVFDDEAVSLATTLAIGFAVLVFLARGEIPTQGWYDSLALGVILGLLGDENLLGKLRMGAGGT